MVAGYIDMWVAVAGVCQSRDIYGADGFGVRHRCVIPRRVAALSRQTVHHTERPPRASYVMHPCCMCCMRVERMLQHVCLHVCCMYAVCTLHAQTCTRIMAHL